MPAAQRRAKSMVRSMNLVPVGMNNKAAAGHKIPPFPGCNSLRTIPYEHEYVFKYGFLIVFFVIFG